jgi:NAD(P)-dependent dehydrogenase (short-subunit alcohol dehydrogenase family)
MDNRENVIFVTGASSGIGNACATFLAKKGYKVYGSCRSPSIFERKADEFFEMLPLDLSDTSSISKAADKVFEQEGRVDALICSAGSGMIGAIEEVSEEDAKTLMDVDFFGTLRTIKAFLPRMRHAGRGRIIIVGALEGLVAAPYQGIFSAAQFALEGLAHALRLEVAGFGIKVGLVELASFHTAFGQRRLVAAVASSETSPYKKNFENCLGVLERDEVRGLDPLIAARAVYSMLESRHMPPRRKVGRLARRILAFSRRWLSPSALERRIKIYYRIE